MILEYRHSLPGSMRTWTNPGSFNKLTTHDHVFGDLGQMATSGKPGRQLKIALEVQDDVMYAPLPGDRQSVSIRAAE